MKLLSGIDKKLLNYIYIAVAVVVGIIVLIFILSLFKPKKYSYSDLEAKLVSGAKSYYKNNDTLLPQENGEVVNVSDDTLDVSLNKNCSGTVSVQKNGDYYLYTPYLDCGEAYQTKNLTEVIKKNNPVVTSKDGLYEIGDSLVFRGEYVDNFVSFAGITWRILRINADGSLRLIQNDIIYTDEVWDDRYNINRDDNVGINDFELSRLKNGLNRIYYERDTFNDSAKEKILFKPLCIGKRNLEETNNSGNVECSIVTKEAMPIGLMQTNEYELASIDSNCIHMYDASCNNYNYLATLQKTTWTLNADSSTTYKAYKFSGDDNEPYFESNCSNESGLRIVINLSGEINYNGGSGTEEDPYIVK